MECARLGALLHFLTLLSQSVDQPNCSIYSVLEIYLVGPTSLASLRTGIVVAATYCRKS